MKNNFLLLLFLCFEISVFSQEFNPKILELPESPTIQDFSFLKNELENVQVIMLGENAHFDGNVFEIRNTIIQYLYNELGFKTIAFEAGIYDVRKALQEIENGENVNTALQKSLMGAWGFSKEFQPLFKFYTKHQKDIKLVGFDNQLTGDYGSEFFVNDLYSYCDKNFLNFTIRGGDFDLLMESMVDSYYYDEGDIPFNKFQNSFKKLLNDIEKLPDSDDNFYWKQNIKSILALAEDIYKEQQLKRKIVSFSAGEADNVRDKLMADNLLAYIKRHPDEKIICLGANVHFSNNAVGVENKDLKKFKSMGSHLKKVLGDKMYSLASVTAPDQFIMNGEIIGSTPIIEHSFEYYLLQKKSKHIFIDANQKSLETPILHRLFSNDTFIKTSLNTMFDGYLFFKEWRESVFIKGYKSSLKGPVTEEKKETYLVLEGSITNKTSREPLAYALIKLPNSNNIFTYSDINGFYKLKIPLEIKVDSIEIHSSYHLRKTVPYQKELKIEFDDKINVLNEVVVKAKLSAHKVIEKVIKRINRNYPTKPFNLKRYSHLISKIDTLAYTDVEYVSEEYDRGYLSKARNSYRAKEIRWNAKNLKIKALPVDSRGSLRGFLFNTRKLKKYNFTFEKNNFIDDKEVYVISFSTTKKHYTYTYQPNISNYHGKIYINKEDYAIVRLVQYWDIIEYNPAFKVSWFLDEEHSLKGIFIKEKSTLNYKERSNKYYRKNQVNEFLGYFLNDNNIKIPISRILRTYWFDENYKNPEAIEFDKLGIWMRASNAAYNPEFWKIFTKKPETN